VDLLHDRCAGLDVSKKDVKACVRSPGARANQRHTEVRTFATTTNALLELRDWLVEQRVTLVAIEATGDYWRPPFYLLEGDVNVILVNPAHAKGLPGRKSDVTDSMWLAQLGECGLLKASFVPPQPIRQLRDLTRYRTTLSREHTREASRLEKELEDAGIKLSSVASDILGVSGRAMLEALIAGERDPQVLAQMAKGRMRTKITPLTQALVGRFGQHHAFLCRMHLDRLDALDQDIAKLSARIQEALAPFRDQLARLDTIPGVGPDVAEVIIAETGADMSRFPPLGTSPPGPASPPDSTSPVNETNLPTPDTATTGSPAPSASRPWPPTAPRTPRSSAHATGVFPDVSANSRPWLPSSTRSSQRPGTSYRRTPTTTTSAATTTPNATPNAPYDASPATPTVWATPSASTPSRPHNAPNAPLLTAIFDAASH